MSDEERINGEELQDEVDDLFGDDEEDEQETQSKKQIEDDDDNDDEEEEEEGESEQEYSETSNQVVDISLPRHAIAHVPEKDTFMLKMPVFLNVEAHPFDPNEFKARINENAELRQKTDLTEKQKQNELVSEKLTNENTIRWRYSNLNDEIIKQSNAHFIQWDDGSLSLKIGQEFFDIKELPIFDNYLVRSHDNLEILQNDSIITKTVNLLPSSTLTSTHRKLTQAVKSIQKKSKILGTITDDDPLKKQRLADEYERKTLKMKRQLESKRRLQEERLERSNSPSLRNERPSAYERYARTYGEDEYEEDDFVANDEEEEEGGYDDEEEEEEEGSGEEEEEQFEKGAERLRKLKEEGAAKYRERSHDSDEEAKTRKKRRIIESDEDED
ncbi:RNA polymerase-associated protein LEO1 [Spathaspora sp. JA1]|nr:RNA polymerase-associated protein LEO1 [Spathaspora sp. JA1]